jgi:hypothetical protein
VVQYCRSCCAYLLLILERPSECLECDVSWELSKVKDKVRTPPSASLPSLATVFFLGGMIVDEVVVVVNVGGVLF